MRAVKTIYQIVWNFIKRMERDHVSAYAAQAAYFIMLSFIPIIMLLLALLKYTPVTQTELQRIFEGGVPDSVYPMILQIINEVYSRSSTLIPMTALVTVWSAGRGVLALTRGFNCIYKVDETRNYVRLRIRSSGYTVLFIISVVLSLTVSRLKIFAHITGLIISVRTIMMLCILVTFFTLIYRFLPNRRGAPILLQVPGAMFTAAAWSGFSFFFSIYVDHFGNYTRIYGSLTTLIVVMLWLYICMYIVMIGAAINSYYEGKFREFEERARRRRFVRREAAKEPEEQVSP